MESFSRDLLYGSEDLALPFKETESLSQETRFSAKTPMSICPSGAPNSVRDGTQGFASAANYLRGTPQLSNNGTKRHSFPSTFPSRDRRPEQTGPRRSSLPSGSAFPFCAWESPSSPSSPSSPVENRRPDTEKRWTSSQTQKESLNEIPTKDGAKEGSTIAAILDDGAVSRKHEEKEHCEGGVGNSEGDFSFSPFSQTTFAPPQRDGNDKSRPTLSHTFSLPLPRPSASSSDLRTPPSRLFRSLPNVLSTSPAPNSPLTPDFSPVQEEEEEDPARLLPSGESLPPPTSHDPAPASASLRRPFLPGGLEEGQRSDKQEGHQDDAHQKERENPMQTVKETRQEKEKHTKRSYRRGTLSKDRKRTHAASSELNAPRQQLSGHSPSPGLSRSDRYRASSEGDPLSRLAAASMVGDLDRMRNVLCDDPREVNRTAVRGAGRTALHFAAMKGHSQAVALLLDFNACVNSQDRHGNTPLHLAASAGHGEAAFVLLRKRANPELRNKHGSKAAKLATLRGHFAVVSLLRSAGCLSQTRVGPGNRGGGGLRCGARSSASHSSSSFRCSLSDVSFSLSQEGQRLSHLPSASGVSVSSAAGRERAVTESSFVAVEKASSTGNLNEAKGPSRKEDLLFGEAANDSHAKDEQREGRGASREPPNRSIRRAFQHGKMVQRLLGKSKGRGGHDNDMLGGAANDATARTDRQEIERLHELLEEGKEIEEEWRRGSSDRSMTLEEADLKNESKPPQRSERNPGGKSNKVPPPPSPPDHFGLLLDDRLRVVPSKSNSRSALPSHQQTPSAEDACSERTSNGDRQNERKSGGASAAWFVSSRMVSKARQQKTKRANESTESVQNPRGRLQTMGRKVMKSSLVRPTRDETESSVGMDHRGRGEGGEAEFVHMGEEGEEEEQAQVSEQDGQNVIGGDERRNDKNDAMQGRARGAFRKVTQASRLQQPPRKPAAAESLSVQVQNGIGVGDELGQTGPPIDSSGGAPIDLPGELDMEIEGEEEGVGVEGGAKSPPKVLKAKALAKVRAAGALQGKGAGRSEPMIRDLHQTTAVEEEREEDESNGGGVRKPKKFSARAVLQATRLRKGGWGKEGKVDDKGNAVTDAVEEEGAFEIMSEEGKEDAEEVEVPVEDVLRGQGEGKTGTREEDASVSPMREKGHSTQRKAVDRAKVLTRLLKSSALKQPLTGDEKEEQEQHNSSGEEGNGDVIGEAEKDVVEEEKNWKEAGGRRRGVGALYALHRATKTAKLFSQKGSKQDEEESPKETSKENGDSFFVSLSEDGNGKVSSQGNVSLSDAARQAARANRLLSRFAAQRKEGQSGPPPSSDPPEPKNPKESPAAKRRTSFYRRNRGLMHARRLLEPTKEENEKEKNPLQEALSSGWLVSGTREPVGALTAASGGGQKKTENKKRTTGKNSSQWQSTSHEISPSDPANRDIFSTQHSYPVSRTRFQHTLLELRTEDRQASMRLKQDPGSYYRSKTESLNGLLCDFEQMKVVGGMSEHSVENEKERLRAYGKDHTAASLRKTAAQMRSAKNEFPDDPRDSSLGLVGRGVCVPSRNGQREIPLGVKDAFWGPPTEISREQNVQETAHVEEQEGERLQNGQTTKKKTMQLRLPEEEGEGEGDDGGVSKLQPKEDTTRKVTTTEQKTNDPFPSSLLSMKVKRSPSDLKKDAHVHSTPWSHTLPAEDVCTDTLSDIYATLNKLPNPSPHTHKTTCEPIVRPPYQPTQTSSESRENRARELQARLDGSSFSRRLAYGLPEHIQDGDLLPSGESEGEGERIEEEGSFDAGGETGGPREGTFLTVATGQTECIEEGSGISSHVRQKSRRPETHEEDRIEKVPLAALMTENATQEERFVPTAEEAEGGHSHEQKGTRQQMKSQAFSMVQKEKPREQVRAHSEFPVPRRIRHSGSTQDERGRRIPSPSPSVPLNSFHSNQGPKKKEEDEPPLWRSPSRNEDPDSPSSSHDPHSFQEDSTSHRQARRFHTNPSKTSPVFEEEKRHTHSQKGPLQPPPTAGSSSILHAQIRQHAFDSLVSDEIARRLRAVHERTPWYCVTQADRATGRRRASRQRTPQRQRERQRQRQSKSPGRRSHRQRHPQRQSRPHSHQYRTPPHAPEQRAHQNRTASLEGSFHCPIRSLRRHAHQRSESTSQSRKRRESYDPHDPRTLCSSPFGQTSHSVPLQAGRASPIRWAEGVSPAGASEDSSGSESEICPLGRDLEGRFLYESDSESDLSMSDPHPWGVEESDSDLHSEQENSECVETEGGESFDDRHSGGTFSSQTISFCSPGR